jgi:hypothetical protein
MWNKLPAPARSILDALLDQYEQPGRQRVARVRLSEDRHHDYFHADDFTVRRDTNEILQRLTEQGTLRLHWRKWEEGNWLDKVDLKAERVETIYQLLGRAPQKEQEAMLRQLLAAQSPIDGWHSDFLQWARRQLEIEASVIPLRLSSDPVDTQWNHDLLLALAAVSTLRSPLLERKFSVQLFGDSKRFRTLRNAVIKILRRHHPDSSVFGENGRALLQAHLLERAPEYVPIAGPLVLQADGRPLDLAPFVPSVAISGTTLHNAMVISCGAVAVVTVENLTSFSELVAAKPVSFLAIYTGGFAAPAVIGLLQMIRAIRPELPIFHWGDMDVGGLRILTHLRLKIGEIGALAMDVVTFENYRRHAKSLTEKEREGLKQLRAQPALDDCVQLIERLLETNEKLEQEAIDAAICAQAVTISA